MYTRYFGLTDKPFSITPDPRYLFMSARHGEALAHLVYGVTESGGFIQLTGEVGTGKTTLVRSLLQNRLPDNADVAVVLNPQLTAIEFLATIVEELSIDEAVDIDSTKSLTDALNRFLLKAHADGRRVILIVDEAQNLAPGVLEQVRLLTNLETAKQKLLQIILIGQPELRELLSRNDLRQLAQRITGRYHLEPLTRDETSRYVLHRMRVAGALNPVFTDAAIQTVFRLTQGVPRLVNVICDRALLAAYAVESPTVTPALVRRAAAEVRGEEDLPGWGRGARVAAGIAAILVVGLSVAGLWQRQPAPAAVPAPAVAETTSVAALPDSPDDVEPVAEAVVLPDLDAQLRLAGELTTRERSFASLASLWTDAPIRDCRDAESAGLRCIEERGAFGTLRQLNRPAILTLVDRSGGSHQVLLKSLRGDQAVLSIGGVDAEHPLLKVTEFWLGEYLLLWRPPNGQAVALLPGMTDPNVLWLRQSLATIGAAYKSEDMESSVYTNDLAARVRDFQRDHRLVIDGMAGRQTQIIINTLLADASTPTLATTGDF